MLEKQASVSVAMPFCDIGVVEVWTTKKGGLTEKVARKVIETNKKFTVKAFLAKKPAKSSAKGGARKAKKSRRSRRVRNKDK